MHIMKAQTSDYLLFALVYFFEGAVSMAGIALPLFMKEELGISIPLIGIYSGIMAFPWVLKPVYGLLSDYVPVFGYRRKSYLIIAALTAMAGWILTSSVSTVTGLLLAQLVVDVGIASLDVFTDGLAVQKSTNKNRGVIQSICWGSRSFGAIIGSLLSGYLLLYLPYKGVFTLTGALPLLVIAVCLFIKEPDEKIKPFSQSVTSLLKAYATKKDLWWIALFLFLFFATPSFGTPLFFYLRENLGFPEVFIGILNTLSSVGGVLGAVMYVKTFDRLSLSSTLAPLVWLNMLITLTYLLLGGTYSAIAIYIVGGFIGSITLIACMKLIAEACPIGGEATTFALITSIVNLGGSVVSPLIGGWLYNFISLPALIIVAALSNLIALIALKGVVK